MKKKNWILFAGLTLAVAGYALFDLKNEKRKEEIKEEKSKVISFRPDQINEISVLLKEVTKTTKEGGEVLSNKIKLIRTPEGWKLEEPIQEVADQAAVDEFIEGLTTEKAEEIKPTSGEVDWKVFGLDEPRGEIDLQNNLGEKVSFLISSKKNYQGDAFLRRNQDMIVLLASSTWFTKLEKRPFDFRDHRLFKKSTALVTEMSVENTEGHFAIQLADGKWKSSGHEDWKLDQEKTNEFMQNLTGSLVEGFEKEAAPTPEEIKKWGLKTPRAVIHLKLKEGGLWEATLGRDHDLTNRVMVSDPLLVAKISAPNAEKFADVTLDVLRDRHELLAFKSEDVRSVEIQSMAGTTELRLQGKSWEANKKAFPELKVDSNQVGGLLVRLESLQVGEFLDRRTSLPDKTAKTVILKDEAGKVLLQLKFGETRKLKVHGRDRASVIVQSAAQADPFSIDEGSYKTLGLEPFLTPESEKKR